MRIAGVGFVVVASQLNAVSALGQLPCDTHAAEPSEEAIATKMPTVPLLKEALR